ncbi:hypothetical protein A2Z22_02605 [Candidatus Woesebacteria bacterium RBG_16_34_12]|uniref:Uncharacterized protein n=1 Tax=Candidatus Woesebacteria bacterium RBG_16_34_12 TaxID=1802480 RepID=A0A1F7X6Q0_9BACT|nr:MAG: hypothetical protein A2Z22_02605 [Candidatus Woesebacteria bacterium RBG_16_34_12]
MSERKRAICWDLDNTLGRFGKVYYDLHGKKPPASESSILLRAGIKKLLTTLNNEGFTHYITSSGGDLYIQEAVKRSGLDEFIGKDNIFPVELLTNPRSGGKNYQYPEERFCQEEGEHQHIMLVVGDGPGDQPQDKENLVFIKVSCGFEYSSEIFKRVIDVLWEEGNGSFVNGFRAIFQKAERIRTESRGSSEYSSRRVEVKRYELSDGIILELEFSGAFDYEKGKKIEGVFPQVDIISADKFVCEPEKVEG